MIFNPDHPANRRGKSHAMRLAINAAIARGDRIAICSLGADGEPHVCTVTPIKRARDNRRS